MKKILVTGCNGLVGKFLIEKLLRHQSDKMYLVIGADIKESNINLSDLYKNRFNAEIGYIQSGIDWKPYSSYNRDEINYYQIDFKREEYAK